MTKTFVKKIRAMVEKKYQEEITMVNRQYKKLLTAIDDWSGSVRLDEELGWADKEPPFADEEPPF